MKKPKDHVKGPLPVYMRITVNGIPKENSLKRKWDLNRWSMEAGRASGTKEDEKSLNTYLNTMQMKVYEVHRAILAAGGMPTSEEIRNKLLGKGGERQRMLLEVFTAHNEQMEKLIERDAYAKGTLTHFNTALSHTCSFIKWK